MLLCGCELWRVRVHTSQVGVCRHRHHHHRCRWGMGNGAAMLDRRQTSEILNWFHGMRTTQKKNHSITPKALVTPEKVQFYNLLSSLYMAASLKKLVILMGRNFLNRDFTWFTFEWHYFFMNSKNMNFQIWLAINALYFFIHFLLRSLKCLVYLDLYAWKYAINHD